MEFKKQSKSEYDKKYYQKNKEKIKKKQKTRYKRKKKELIEHNKKYNRKYNKLEDVKKRNNIRKQTIRKYGKLPKGKQYHHTTIPYHIDKFKIMDTNKHRELLRKEYKKRGIKV